MVVVKLAAKMIWFGRNTLMASSVKGMFAPTPMMVPGVEFMIC